MKKGIITMILSFSLPLSALASSVNVSNSAESGGNTIGGDIINLKEGVHAVKMKGSPVIRLEKKEDIDNKEVKKIAAGEGTALPSYGRNGELEKKTGRNIDTHNEGKALPPQVKDQVREKGDNGLYLGAKEGISNQLRNELKEKINLMKANGKGSESVEIRLGDKEKKALKEELSSKIKKHFAIESIDDVSVEADGEGKMQYQVKAKKHFRIFGLFSVNGDIELKVDPETGEVLEFEKPWYSIFSF